MMLLEESPEDHTAATCPLCPRPSTTGFLAACRWRSLLERGWSWVERCSPLRRLGGLSPWKSGVRWLVLLVLVTLFMMIFLSYTKSYRPGALGWFLSADNRSAVRQCRLVCRDVPRKDARWRPRMVPMEHACLVTATLPVPCVPNSSRSEILETPPINFLPNYRNPCWYEDLSTPIMSTTDNDTEGTTPVSPYYSHNLFTCFSHTMRRLFVEMTGEFWAREEAGGAGQGPRRLRCLPYFYIAGMPKSGSTDLFRKVMQHPDVVQPPFKEPHWWSKNRFGMRLNYSSAISLRDYIDLFDNAALQMERRVKFTDGVSYDDYDPLAVHSDDEDLSAGFHPAVTGDASASTFWNNDEWWRLPENCGLTEPRFTNAQHIRRLTPDARIIVILRNPTNRLFSDYLYFTKSNKSVANFHQEVKESVEKMRECMATHTLRACIYDKQVANGKGKVRLRVGVYHVYLSEWLKVFPPDQLLVLRTEDYSQDTREAMRKVYQFLKLRPLRKDEEDHVLNLPIANTRRSKDRELGAMWEQTRQTLREFYHPHNQLLARTLHDSRYLWDDVIVPSQVADVIPNSQPDVGGGPASNVNRGENGDTNGGGSQTEEERTSPKQEDGDATVTDVTENVSDGDYASSVVTDSSTPDTSTLAQDEEN